MASCTDNSPIADAYIVSQYPELLIVDIDGTTPAATVQDTMDFLAKVGRLSYVITLLEKDHGPALVDHITTELGSNGYVAKADATTVTISCGGC